MCPANPWWVCAALAAESAPRVPSCPQHKHTAEPTPALQLSLAFMGALSCTWLLGLAVQLQEEEVAVGNATERKKRGV